MYTYTYIYIYMYTHMYICIYVYICICIYMCTQEGDCCSMFHGLASDESVVCITNMSYSISSSSSSILCFCSEDGCRIGNGCGSCRDPN